MITKHLVFSKDNFDILCEAYEELRIKYEERGASMRDSADVVRSLYAGSEVSKRITALTLEIERLNGELKQLRGIK